MLLCIATSDSATELDMANGKVASPSTPVLIKSPQSLKFKSSFPVNASRSLCIRSLPSYFSFIHNSANSIASPSVFDTACNCSLHKAFFEKHGWLDKSDNRDGICSNFAMIIFHLPANPLASLALSRTTGTSSCACNNQSSVERASTAISSPSSTMISVW
ncbi:hypothetical protein V8G54_022129 [Vigna mungo]|uniref:Uncharacterized protein n=1 Tax=Vigna mungo TaxID=3915 RepID=A0AAQ3NIN1_VIGMU